MTKPAAVQKLLPFVFMARGRSGTSWVCAVLSAHRCGYCNQESSCHLMRKELHPNLYPMAQPLPTRSFYTAENGSVLNGWAVRSNKRSNSSCDVVAVGGKCGVDRELFANEPRAPPMAIERFKALLRPTASSAATLMHPAPVLHMVRRNALDRFLAAGGGTPANGPRRPIGSVDNPRVRLDGRTLVSKLRNATRKDQLYRSALEAAAFQAGVPFLHVVYEDLCASPDGFAAIFRFLGLSGNVADAHEATERVKTRKTHTLPKEKLIVNYAEVKNILTRAGLAHYLKDEDCTRTHRHG